MAGESVDQAEKSTRSPMKDALAYPMSAGQRRLPSRGQGLHRAGMVRPRISSLYNSELKSR